MEFFEVFVSMAVVMGYAVGLSMDAFAVSLCKGLAMRKAGLKEGLICGLWFGGFQALMPTIGFFLARIFGDQINAIAPWIAFGLLALIGGNMLKEAFSKDSEETSGDMGIKTMFIMAVATSIDAMAAGVSMGLSGENIWINAACIGVTTCVLSAIGVKIGNVFGARFEKKAQLAGGIILILLGLKILLEHLLKLWGIL